MNYLAALTLFASLALGQASVTFEVASIKPTEPGPKSVTATAGSLVMRGQRQIDLIMWAYRVQDYQVSGPADLREMRFDVAAKASGPATESEMRVMMQALLADRFKLVFHRKTEEKPVYILTVAKGGHKLKEVATEGSPSFRTGKLSLTGSGARISQMTDFLSGDALNAPVIDRTGLTGLYDYAVDINAFVTEQMMRASQNGPPIEAPGIVARALQEQLGLKLDAGKAPVETLVIDHVEKVPTEN